MNALFVHDPADLDAPVPGGVQLCSRQFLAIVRAASAETRLARVAPTRHPLWRIRRRFGLGSYLFYHPGESHAALAAALADFTPSHVFLNRCELLRLAPVCRQLAPGARIVALSHGNKSGDDLYEITGPGGRVPAGIARTRAIWQLGLDLAAESRARHADLDAVCVMSPEEAVLERWLGARRTVILPRVVESAPVPWAPVRHRVGFVGTLDHTPNRVALESLLDHLGRAPDAAVEVRLVGGPGSAGRALASRYPRVRYLGRLDDAALHAEIAGWSLFLNPVFWLSRGASMKLGQALGWALPVLTTPAGARGYDVAEPVVFVSGTTPAEFVARMCALLADPAALEAARARLLPPRARWPGVAELAAHLQAALA